MSETVEMLDFDVAKVRAYLSRHYIHDAQALAAFDRIADRVRALEGENERAADLLCDWIADLESFEMRLELPKRTQEFLVARRQALPPNDAPFPDVCGNYDPVSKYVCIRQLGHSERHPWEQAPATTEGGLPTEYEAQRLYANLGDNEPDSAVVDRLFRSIGALREARDGALSDLAQLRAERDEAVQALREIERDEHTGVPGPLHDGFLVDGCSGCIARHFLFLHQGPP